MLGSGHKSSQTKNRQYFKDRRKKKHSRETTSNLSKYACENAMNVYFHEMRRILHQLTPLPSESSRELQQIEAQTEFCGILCSMLTHDKGVDWLRKTQGN